MFFSEMANHRLRRLQCRQFQVNIGGIFESLNLCRCSALKCFVWMMTLLTMFGLRDIARAQGANSAEKLEMFKFEEVKDSKPDQIVPRKWNWEIKLSPEQSQRRFQIVQETLGKKGLESEFSQAIFTEKDLHKNPGDIIYVKLHTGDEKPTINMGKKGNVGLGVSFARAAGGYGSSSWIVLPGKILKSAVREQRLLTNGELILISFETVDAAGNQHTTDVKLAESR
jgi:hypothetical protein